MVQMVGIIGDVEYVSNTVPVNAVISRATTDTDTVTIHVLAEGGSFYSPQLSIHGIPELEFNEGDVIELIQDDHDIRTFHGHITVHGINSSTELTIQSSTGATASVHIDRASPGPSIQELTIGEYPNGQTSVMNMQIMSASGVVENDAEYLDIRNTGAAIGQQSINVVLGDMDSAGAGYRTFDFDFTVSDKSGTHNIEVRGSNNFGTSGDYRVSDNSIELDQTVPSITDIVVNYPNSQTAIKNSEVATVTFNLMNSTGSSYSADSSISITSGDNSRSELLMVAVGDGSDSVSNPNLTITSYRSSNGSQTTTSVAVNVLQTTPELVVSIQNNPNKLKSSPTGEQYKVILSSNVDLDSSVPPSMVAEMGTLTPLTQLTPVEWTATLTIADDDDRGDFNFVDISALSISGDTVTEATSTGYTIGGFTNRTLTIPLYDDTPGNEVVGRTTDIGVNVSDPLNLTVLLSGVPLTYVPSINDTKSGFTIVDQHQGFTDPYIQVAFHNPNGRILYINDRDQSGSNTTGSMTVVVGESV